LNQKKLKTSWAGLQRWAWMKGYKKQLIGTLVKKTKYQINPSENYSKLKKQVIIQLLRLKPPCLMDICFDAKRLTSCKYPSDRALGITFFNGLHNYKSKKNFSF
jgi:hypothetical protein